MRGILDPCIAVDRQTDRPTDTDRQTDGRKDGTATLDGEGKRQMRAIRRQEHFQTQITSVCLARGSPPSLARDASSAVYMHCVEQETGDKTNCQRSSQSQLLRTRISTVFLPGTPSSAAYMHRVEQETGTLLRRQITTMPHTRISAVFCPRRFRRLSTCTV